MRLNDAFNPGIGFIFTIEISLRSITPKRFPLFPSGLHIVWTQSGKIEEIRERSKVKMDASSQAGAAQIARRRIATEDARYGYIVMHGTFSCRQPVRRTRCSESSSIASFGADMIRPMAAEALRCCFEIFQHLLLYVSI